MLAPPDSTCRLTPSPARSLGAWALYDWGSSAFPVVVSTFVIAPYVTQAIAPDPVTGQAQWGWMQAGVGLCVALLLPLLGAHADATGRRRKMLVLFTLLNVAATAAIWWAKPDAADLLYALLAVGVASVSFEFAGSFYNAALPDVAAPEQLGRVSAIAWGLGYFGGVACLGLSLVLLVGPDPGLFNLDRDAAEHVRATVLLVAAWALFFTLPALMLLPDKRSGGVPVCGAAPGGLVRVSALLCSLPRRPGIARLLAARLFYTDGLNTFSLFGAIYAAGAFGMGFEEILVLGITMNVSAGAGCFAAAFVEERLGSRRVVVLSLASIVALGVPLLATANETWFWALALAVAFLFGAPQSASRTLMVRLARPGDRAACFALFAVTGRVTGFVGPAVVAAVTAAAGSQSLGIGTTLVFIAIGAGILASGASGNEQAGAAASESRGTASARRADKA